MPFAETVRFRDIVLNFCELINKVVWNKDFPGAVISLASRGSCVEDLEVREVKDLVAEALEVIIWNPGNWNFC